MANSHSSRRARPRRAGRQSSRNTSVPFARRLIDEAPLGGARSPVAFGEPQGRHGLAVG